MLLLCARLLRQMRLLLVHGLLQLLLLAQLLRKTRLLHLQLPLLDHLLLRRSGSGISCSVVRLLRRRGLLE